MCSITIHALVFPKLGTLVEKEIEPKVIEELELAKVDSDSDFSSTGEGFLFK